MNQPNVSSLRILIFLILSFAIITGILESELADYAMGQRATGPGGVNLPPSDNATESTLATTTTTGPGGINLPPSSDATGPGGIDLPPSDNATETTLDTTTTTGPGGINLPSSSDATGPGGIDLPPSDNATETTLATTTTSTSTFSSTKGGFHISTTITNTTTVIPVQP
jgi:hypothetical protein